VPPATMTLRASAPGYVSQEQTIETGLLEIITFTLVPTGPLTTQLARTGERGGAR